jgi:cytochrome oxidase Cu insertion factor (SCO1/SenC/PrrC family)
MFVRNPNRPVVRLAVIGGAIGLFLLGYYWGNRYKYRTAPPPNIQGVLVGTSQGMPSFELHDATGMPFTDKDLKGHWTLIAFANLEYARGHLAVTRMIDVHNRLADEPDLQRTLQLALTAESQAPALAQDFSRLSPALKVLSGKADQIDKLRTALGDAPQGETAATDEEGAPFFLIDPKGRLIALFTGEEQPAAIAHDLSSLAARPDLFPSDEK